MAVTIGIRGEKKSRFERRTPLTPEAVQRLVSQNVAKFCVETSATRVFGDETYAKAGAKIVESLAECDVIIGVKEVAIPEIHPKKTYLYFSHVIKGQSYNMPMLKDLMAKGATLLDYEKITGGPAEPYRVFSRYAGIVGMIDSLHLMGERLELEGVRSPLGKVKQAIDFADYAAAQAALEEVGDALRAEGQGKRPLVVGICGEGNVGRGAMEVMKTIGAAQNTPADLLADRLHGAGIAVVVFSEQELVRRKQGTFDLQEYYAHPELYEGQFESYLPRIDILVNAIYWDARYPRLLTKKWLGAQWAAQGKKPGVIGDVSCDTHGGIEIMERCTQPDKPAYTVSAQTLTSSEAPSLDGPQVLAVDNLPCELPRDASTEFSAVLEAMVPAMVKADWSVPFAQLDLPDYLKRGVILLRGELTPDFEYLRAHLKG